jgi:hypothetical protein
MTKPDMIHCDAFGCTETHPIEHEAMTEPGFRFGKWLGWLYLDINRPDLMDRQQRPRGYAAELTSPSRLTR